MALLELGTRLVRREPLNDDWDLIEVRGWAESSEIREPVVSPVSFGEAIACDPSNLLKHYTLAADDPSAEIEAGLEKIEKLSAWETPASEITNA